ncbi:MAG: hypothetical protein N4A46_10455, partial [Schleiferiaceae bacterium]|nr:hypothetical protein [Schleiferiaceae bacterium]
MIKRLLFSFLGMISFISYGQDIKAELGSEGKFLVISNGGFVKMLIRDNDPTAIPDAVPGEFNLYTDGGNFFIRDGAFEAYPVDTMGVDYEYNFMYVDGANGRIGFNIISGRTDDANNFTELPLTSSITLFGSIATRVRLMDGTDSYELKQDDHTLILDNSSNNPSTDIVLPAVATAKGREYRFKRNIDRTGKIFIKPQPGEKLNGDVNNVVDLNNENASLEVVCDGDSWWVITELSPNLNRTTLTASATLASEEIIDVNFTMANSTINLNLPDAADYEGKTYAIKRNANGATFDDCLLNITPAGANTIDQFNNSSLLQLTRNFEAVIIESN